MSIAVVVSPLVSLMIGQKDKFSPLGVSVEYVRESLDKTAYDNVKNGKCQLVYISPETILLNSEWRDLFHQSVYQQHLIALFIDKAHCIKKWYDIHNINRK